MYFAIPNSQNPSKQIPQRKKMGDNYQTYINVAALLRILANTDEMFCVLF
jgi:hypothetical protein